MTTHFFTADGQRLDLIVCATLGCRTRTLPATAAREAAGGPWICDLCRMTPEERRDLRDSIRRARERIVAMKRVAPDVRTSDEKAPAAA